MRVETYLGVPKHVLPGLVHFVEDGCPTGSFLEAVIVNDLADACGRADDVCGPALQDIVRFLYNVFPGPAWSRSKKGYQSWLEMDSDKRKRIYSGCLEWMEFKEWYNERGGA